MRRLLSPVFALCAIVPLSVMATELAPVSLLPESAHWQAHPHGWLVGEDRAALEQAMEDFDRATDVFARRTGMAVPDGVVLAKTMLSSRPDLLASGQFDWVLPWDFSLTQLSGHVIDPAQRASIRDQITAQLTQAQQAPDPEMVERLVQQAVAQLGEKRARPAVKPLAHEIAHAMFSASVWTRRPDRPGYASGAPDWLDETFAVAAEDGALIQSRREAFKRLADGGKIQPLREWFQATHPVLEAARKLISDRTGAATLAEGVYTFSQEDLAASGVANVADASAFYAQARGFLDYLDANASSPTVLGEMALALQTESDLDRLLGQNGLAWGLPGSVEQLDQHFRDWVNHSVRTQR